ncbi:MAG: hypothetical protein RLZZ81_1281 [Pseudomonadota bacterium]|jgi:hypothetical protein
MNLQAHLYSPGQFLKSPRFHPTKAGIQLKNFDFKDFIIIYLCVT